MGGNHDKLTDLSRCPTTGRRFRSPQDSDRRSRARRLGRDDEDGFCGLRRAARPDRRANNGIAAPAARSASRRPLSGCSPGVDEEAEGVRSGRPAFRPSPAPWRSSASRPDSAGPKARSTFRPGDMFCSATFPTTASCASREDDGHLSVYRQPSMNSNGNTIDREGRLITCEHCGRRVTRTELDGSITIIADKYNGKKLNSPNDAVVAADGSIWFCDPAYGIGGYLRGHQGRRRAGQEKRLPGRSEIRRHQDGGR